MTELGRLFRYETTYWRIAVPLLQGILLIGCPAYPDYMIGAGIFVCIGLILSCSLRQIPLGLPISLLIVFGCLPSLDFLAYGTPRGTVGDLLGGSHRTE